MSLLGSFCLTGTALAPVVYVYAVLAFAEGEYGWAAILSSLGSALILSGIGLLTYFRRCLEKLDQEITSAEAADRETVSILVVYLLPLLRTSFQELDLLLLVPASAIFFALALTGHNHHLNPLLILFGWKFYKVGTPEGVSYLLITRLEIRDAKMKLPVRLLSRYTIIDAD